MKFTATALLLAPVALAAKYPITGNEVNCRSGPSTSSDIVTSYKKGDEVQVTCQIDGEDIFGNTIWDQTEDGCYVADFYVKTGSNTFVTEACNAEEGDSDTDLGFMANDYPYKNSCGGVDKWNFYKCQCTSFVAWRLNDRKNIKFTNQYKGCNFGNANTWDECAKKVGLTVNKKPKVGAVAQSNAGSFGHVAWVSKVSGSKVTIEEYNWATSEGYGKRTVAASTFNYLHF